MADNNKFAQLMMSQAQRSAREGKSLFSNPVTNYALGLKTGGLGEMLAAKASQKAKSAQPQQQPKKRPKPSAPQKMDPVQESLLARIRTTEETGFAVPGAGMIPGAAFRPEVQELFKGAGGVSAFDATDLTPEEQDGLRYLLDPKWVASQNDPGATLSDAEKAQALQVASR